MVRRGIATVRRGTHRGNATVRRCTALGWPRFRMYRVLRLFQDLPTLTLHCNGASLQCNGLSLQCNSVRRTIALQPCVVTLQRSIVA